MLAQRSFVSASDLTELQIQAWIGFAHRHRNVLPARDYVMAVVHTGETTYYCVRMENKGDRAVLENHEIATVAAGKSRDGAVTGTNLALCFRAACLALQDEWEAAHMCLPETPGMSLSLFPLSVCPPLSLPFLYSPSTVRPQLFALN